MTTGLCIIADDLTGALDAAAPFAGRGATVRVWLDPQAFLRDIAAAWEDGLRIFALSTDSRETDPQAAAALLGDIAAALPPQIRIFKKIDSRMKGHIAAELAALHPKRLLVAPAIPEFGRIVRAGHVTGFGVQSPIAIAPLLGDLAQKACIPDCGTTQDMAELVQAPPPDMLLVGARGLAEAMARQMLGRNDAAPVTPRARHPLIVIGSRDPITLSQVEKLRAERAVDYRTAPNGISQDHRPLRGLTVIQASEAPQPASGPQVAQALAASLAPLLPMADLLFITGGATAQTVLASFGITHMTLLGECFAGVPIATTGKQLILTKSGGFGEADVLVKLAAILDHDSEDSAQ